jgi:hypothetical protein
MFGGHAVNISFAQNERKSVTLTSTERRGQGIHSHLLGILTKMKDSFRTIGLAGTTVGVLDGTAAVVVAGLRGVPPDRVFQYISSGLLGRSSYEGGAATVILGVILHFIVAFGAATIFVLLARSLGFIRKNPLILGPLYGIAVYFFMSEVVVALSNVTRQPRTLSGTVTGILIHIFFVGLPIALITSHSPQPMST